MDRLLRLTDDWKALFPSPIPHTPRYGHGKVNDVHGVIIIPDDWSDPKPNSKEFTTGYKDWDNYNQYEAAEWKLMESAGAVFLPAACFRDGTEVKNQNETSAYWYSSPKDDHAYLIFFNSNFVGPAQCLGRYYGLSDQTKKYRHC
ncbi:MAG: hypothetical protein IKS00_04440 [Bacteroidales bacterium]|nr:hypothetical protein [Bacteroidales bacterium]